MYRWLLSSSSFLACITEHSEDWRQLHESMAPHLQPLPGEWMGRLSPFQRLVVLRAIRPDKLQCAIQQYVADTLGRCVQESQAMKPACQIMLCTSVMCNPTHGHHRYIIPPLPPCSRYIEPQLFALEACLADSSANMPLVLVLSPGSDPMSALLRLAEERGARVDSVSLGQGQAPFAVRLIQDSAAAGNWAVLQVVGLRM
jgi:dynein heavy chain, axonemal